RRSETTADKLGNRWGQPFPRTRTRPARAEEIIARSGRNAQPRNGRFASRPLPSALCPLPSAFLDDPHASADNEFVPGKGRESGRQARSKAVAKREDRRQDWNAGGGPGRGWGGRGEEEENQPRGVETAYRAITLLDRILQQVPADDPRLVQYMLLLRHQ